MRSFLVCALALGVCVVGASASAQTVRDISNRGACSTAGVEAISAQLSEAQRCLNPSAFVRFAPHPGITLQSERVHPYAQASARDAIHRAAADVPMTINSAFRTVADQYVLHNSGGCGIAASPGRSNHQSGRAIDVNNWSAARSGLQAQGCTWFGAGDEVHFDCPGSDLRDDSVRAFQSLWNVNNPGDTIAVDGAYGPQTDARLAMTPAGGFPLDACEVEPAGGRLRGVVYSGGDTEMRVLGASVQIAETGESMSVNAMGEWSFDVGPGEYTVEARADGFAVGRRTCIVAESEVWCSIELREGSMEMDGTLRGSLVVAGSMAPLTGEVVSVETGMRTTSDESGAWSLTLAPGNYMFVGSADGYVSVTRSCTVVAGMETECEIELSPEAGVSILQGVIYVEGDIYQRVIGATVRIRATSAETVSREGDGLYLFEVPPGTYTVEAGGPGFVTDTRVCVVEGDGVVWCSIGLESDGTSGGLRVESPSEEGAEIPDEELERSGVAPISGGCAVGAGHSSALWLNAAFLLLFFRRRYSRA